MNRIIRMRNRILVPGFLINSMPKGGSHLLGKVGLLPGIRWSGMSLHHESVDEYTLAGDRQAAMVPIGIDSPIPLSSDAVRRVLERLQKEHMYATGHFPFSDQLVTLLSQTRLKMLLMLRDPRDVAVSHAIFVGNKQDHFLHAVYEPLSESERLMTSIKGTGSGTSHGPALLSIQERYQSLLPWAAEPFTYTARFERLIGPKGGGTRDMQLAELRNIARHLSIWHTPGDIEHLADQLYGGTRTFRKGVIGDWQSHFSAEHKQVFKEIAGQLLIDLGYEQDLDW